MEFFIIREGQQTGPFSEASVQTMLKEGHARAGDMGWRKGLPGWLPLGEIFQPGFSRPTDLPPPMNGTHSGLRQTIITPQQRALLSYLSIPWEDSMSKEQAALAINDALENPKLTQRFSKWGEEKLRLHEDLFQEEIDYRRANRVVRYTELCQSEAADVVKDITKAHIQVLMESLDKRQPGWEQNSRAALWDYLLPCVNEHFPQLIRTEWKGKLKFGGTPKIAASYTGTPGTDSYVPPADPAPSAMHAAVRGIAFGLCALGLVALGIYVYQPKTPNSEAKNKTAAPAPEPVATPPIPGSPEAVPAAGEVNVAAAPLPPDAAPIGAKPAVEPVPTPPLPPAGDPAVTAVPSAVPGTPAPAPIESAAPMPNPIGANPAPAPVPAPAPAFTPAPPPPGAPETPATPPAGTPPAGTPPAGTQPPAPVDAPALPAGPVVRNSTTLTKPTDAQLQFGKVNLPVGTKLKLIAIEGQNARVNFQNNILLIPIANTDIDPANTIVAPPNAPLPTVAPPPVAPTAPPAPKPAPPKPPSSDL